MKDIEVWGIIAVIFVGLWQFLTSIGVPIIYIVVAYVVVIPLACVIAILAPYIFEWKSDISDFVLNIFHIDKKSDSRAVYESRKKKFFRVCIFAFIIALISFATPVLYYSMHKATEENPVDTEQVSDISNGEVAQDGQAEDNQSAERAFVADGLNATIQDMDYSFKLVNASRLKFDDCDRIEAEYKSIDTEEQENRPEYSLVIRADGDIVIGHYDQIYEVSNEPPAIVELHYKSSETSNDYTSDFNDREYKLDIKWADGKHYQGIIESTVVQQKSGAKITIADGVFDFTIQNEVIMSGTSYRDNTPSIETQDPGQASRDPDPAGLLDTPNDEGTSEEVSPDTGANSTLADATDTYENSSFLGRYSWLLCVLGVLLLCIDIDKLNGILKTTGIVFLLVFSAWFIYKYDLLPDDLPDNPIHVDSQEHEYINVLYEPYVLDSQDISLDDLYHFDYSHNESQRILNWMCARYGYVSLTSPSVYPELLEYYENDSKSWPENKTNNQEEATILFNGHEKHNWDVIVQYQIDRGWRKPET